MLSKSKSDIKLKVLPNIINNEYINCFEEKLLLLTSETYLFHPRRGKRENRIDATHTNKTIVFA